jgi:hypothetical protein
MKNMKGVGGLAAKDRKELKSEGLVFVDVSGWMGDPRAYARAYGAP